MMRLRHEALKLARNSEIGPHLLNAPGLEGRIIERTDQVPEGGAL
jgi:hypothetical protein